MEMIELSEQEKLKLQSMKLEKRKREWLCVKILIQLFAQGKSLLFHPNGKPFFSDGFHISISHSGVLAGIIISNQSIGMDIQFVDEKIHRIQHRFLHKKEYEYLPEAKQRVDFLTIIWSVKEAVYKYFGEEVDFAQDIYVLPFALGEKNVYANYNGLHGSFEFELSILNLEGCNVIYITSDHLVKFLHKFE